ncbi:MAG: alpha/beta hydrolase [Leptospirales bacterium]|jgi:pimeloyl-ACP methyl ester carboxylesterase
MGGLMRQGVGVLMLAGCGGGAAADFSELTIAPEDWHARGRYFETRSAVPGGTREPERFFYVDEGRGDAVIFLHGFPTSSYDWRLLWPALLPERRLIAPDFRGFGFSSKPDDAAYSIRAQADLIEALAKSLKISEARFIVHDYGVSVGQELLARQELDGAPALRVRSMIVLNAATFPGEHRPRLIQKILLSPLGGLVNRLAGYGTFRDNFRKILGKNENVSDAELRAHWYLLGYPDDRRVVHRLMHYIPDREIDGERWARALLESEAPVRMINGSLDPVSGRHVADRYRREAHEAGKVANLIDLRDVGHYPQLEDPAAVTAAIRDWSAGGY